MMTMKSLSTAISEAQEGMRALTWFTVQLETRKLFFPDSVLLCPLLG